MGRTVKKAAGATVGGRATLDAVGRIDTTGNGSKLFWLALLAGLIGGGWWWYRKRTTRAPAPPPPALVAIPCHQRCVRARDACMREANDRYGAMPPDARCATEYQRCEHRCGTR